MDIIWFGKLITLRIAIIQLFLNNSVVIRTIEQLIIWYCCFMQAAAGIAGICTLGFYRPKWHSESIKLLSKFRFYYISTWNLGEIGK